MTINPANEKRCRAGRSRDLTHGLGGASLAGRLLFVRWRERKPCAASAAWGKACFVGEGGDVTLDVSNDMLRRQVTIVGSWTFSTIGQAQCARFIADAGIDVDHLFTHHWRLEEADEAYRLFDLQTTGKGVVHPS